MGSGVKSCIKAYFCNCFYLLGMDDGWGNAQVFCEKSFILGTLARAFRGSLHFARIIPKKQNEAGRKVMNMENFPTLIEFRRKRGYN